VSATDDLEIRDVVSGAGTTCARILGALPHWFGIPESVASFVDACENSPTIIASRGTEDVGIINLRLHNPYAGEVWLMAVLPEYHRQGIGRALLGHAERTLTDSGVEYLQVKTLSATRDDRGYEKTRIFYLASGFRPLEEFPTLWDEQNPALMMVKSLAGRRLRS
jgi:ribosomal protein S18 acetylase RimI-like enzyme